jgi:hypothetical protein
MTKRAFTDVEMEMLNVEHDLAVDVGGVVSVSPCEEIIQYYNKELVSETYFATEDMKEVMFILHVYANGVYIVDNSFMNMLIGIPRYTCVNLKCNAGVICKLVETTMSFFSFVH